MVLEPLLYTGTMTLLTHEPTEAQWHIGMPSASHREDPGSNPGKGRFFRIKMKNVTFELLRCIYSHIMWEHI